MIRRPPRLTPLYSSAASDVYKRQVQVHHDQREDPPDPLHSVELLFQTAVEGAVVVEIGHRVPLGQVTRAVILPCVLDGHAELGSDCLGELQLRLVALRSRARAAPEKAVPRGAAATTRGTRS